MAIHRAHPFFFLRHFKVIMSVDISLKVPDQLRTIVQMDLEKGQEKKRCTQPIWVSFEKKHFESISIKSIMRSLIYRQPKMASHKMKGCLERTQWLTPKDLEDTWSKEIIGKAKETCVWHAQVAHLWRKWQGRPRRFTITDWANDKSSENLALSMVPQLITSLSRILIRYLIIGEALFSGFQVHIDSLLM